MAGIAGITNTKEHLKIKSMNQRMSHRGREHHKSIEASGTLLQAVWNDVEASPAPLPLQNQAVWDGVSMPLPEMKFIANHETPFALAAITDEGVLLARDRLGVKPLYYGESAGSLAFASEVKTLLAVTRDVHEFPPGCMYTPANGFTPFATIKSETLPYQGVKKITSELRLRLEQAIIRRIVAPEMGSWLSGGLDSSAIAALAKPYVRTLHSFVSGVSGASDLEYGRQMAEFLGTQHHELIVTLEDMLVALPKVIYHLESFDALLVRSSVTNYLTAKLASDYVGAVFSGEGGDELFAGYDYIKKRVPVEKIPAELEDIIKRLHNTALQRVDRCSQACGIVALVPFADPEVLDYALRIPAKYKVYRGGEMPVEKWILRKAVEDILPDSILWRPKSKFWQGAGVKNLLAQHANDKISDADFTQERLLPNGWQLNSKEELLYYRIFKEHFGELHNLEWMGRTKGAPVH